MWKHNTLPREINPLMLSWMAGLFDGEGCCSIYKQKDKDHSRKFHYVIMAQVSNTNIGLLEPFLSNFGGKINVEKQPSSKIWTRKTCYQWRSHYQFASNFLKKIFPFIHDETKKQKAKIVIEFVDSNISGRWNHDWNKQDAFYEQIKKLGGRKGIEVLQCQKY